MKTINTIKEFANKSHIGEALIRAVIRQAGGWASFKEAAEDIAHHGAVGGCHGFIYFTDTVKFAKRNKNMILVLLAEYSKEFGQSIPEMLAGWRCLAGVDQSEIFLAMAHDKHPDHDIVMNALSWFALEEVARSYADLTE